MIPQSFRIRNISTITGVYPCEYNIKSQAYLIAMSFSGRIPRCQPIQDMCEVVAKYLDVMMASASDPRRHNLLLFGRLRQILAFPNTSNQHAHRTNWKPSVFSLNFQFPSFQFPRGSWQSHRALPACRPHVCALKAASGT